MDSGCKRRKSFSGSRSYTRSTLQEVQPISAIFPGKKRKLRESPMSRKVPNVALTLSPPSKIVKTQDVEQEVVWRNEICTQDDGMTSTLQIPVTINNSLEEPTQHCSQAFKRIDDVLTRLKQLNIHKAQEEITDNMDEFDKILSQIPDDQLCSTESSSFVTVDVDGVVSKRLLNSNELVLPSPIPKPGMASVERQIHRSNLHGNVTAVQSKDKERHCENKNSRRNLFGVTSPDSGISEMSIERARCSDVQDDHYFDDDFNDLVANLSNDVLLGSQEPPKKSRIEVSQSNDDAFLFDDDDVDWASISAVIKEINDDDFNDISVDETVNSTAAANNYDDFNWDEEGDAICASIVF